MAKHTKMNSFTVNEENRLKAILETELSLKKSNNTYLEEIRESRDLRHKDVCKEFDDCKECEEYNYRTFYRIQNALSLISKEIELLRKLCFENMSEIEQRRTWKITKTAVTCWSEYYKSIELEKKVIELEKELEELKKQKEKEC